jgi:hypothetical protein
VVEIPAYPPAVRRRATSANGQTMFFMLYRIVALTQQSSGRVTCVRRSEFAWDVRRGDRRRIVPISSPCEWRPSATTDFEQVTSEQWRREILGHD